MEAILINNKTGEKKIQDFTVEEYYEFGSNTERLTPGHAVLFKSEAESILKSLFWQTLYEIPIDYPKTDLSVSNDDIKKKARKEILLMLKSKIEKLIV